MERWLGERPAPLEAHDGWAELVAPLAGHASGPGTADDLRWWLGATAGIVRRALADVEAVEVSLDDGDDRAGCSPTTPTRSRRSSRGRRCCPSSTHRHGLEGARVPAGRARRTPSSTATATPAPPRGGTAGSVGCWVQDAAGAVHVDLLEDPAPAGRAALAVEAERLAAWLDGVRVGTVYPSAAMKRALAALG